LAILVSAMFLLLYGTLKNVKRVTALDLPPLLLLLLVPSLYDAFDKSLLALLLLFLGGVYLILRASSEESAANDNRFGRELHEKSALVFGNRLIPLSLVILILFAIGNDLARTYGHQINVDIGPLPASLVPALLDIVSVFLTFTSVALLFVLLFPYLPFTPGYAKAGAFAIFLFLIFLFGIGTDQRLIVPLPGILVGRVIYYLSVPLLIGMYLDINEYMEKENKRRSAEGKNEKPISFQDAWRQYFGNLSGSMGALTTILSLGAPAVYGFLSGQPVIGTYFGLLENLAVFGI
jgi:hypothetical protein